MLYFMVYVVVHLFGAQTYIHTNTHTKPTCKIHSVPFSLAMALVSYTYVNDVLAADGPAMLVRKRRKLGRLHNGWMPLEAVTNGRIVLGPTDRCRNANAAAAAADGTDAAGHDAAAANATAAAVIGGSEELHGGGCVRGAGTVRNVNAGENGEN